MFTFSAAIIPRQRSRSMLIRVLRYYSIENPMESAHRRAFPHRLECDKRYEIDFLPKLHE